MSRSNIPSEVVKTGETLYYIKDNEVCSDVVTFAGTLPAVGSWYNPNDYGWDIKKGEFTLVVPLNDGFATHEEAKEELNKRLGVTYKYKVGDIVYINGYSEATDRLCKIEKCKVVNLPDDDVYYRNEENVGMYLLESYNWENRKWDNYYYYGAYESEMFPTYEELLDKMKEDIETKERKEAEAEELANRPEPKFKVGDDVFVYTAYECQKAIITDMKWNVRLYNSYWSYAVEYLNNMNWNKEVSEDICIKSKDIKSLVRR